MTPEALDRIKSTPRDLEDGDVPDKLIARMERARNLSVLALVAEDVRWAQEWGVVREADRPRLLAAYRAARDRLTRAQQAQQAQPAQQPQGAARKEEAER